MGVRNSADKALICAVEFFNHEKLASGNQNVIERILRARKTVHGSCYIKIEKFDKQESYLWQWHLKCQGCNFRASNILEVTAMGLQVMGSIIGKIDGFSFLFDLTALPFHFQATLPGRSGWLGFAPGLGCNGSGLN